MTERMPVPAGPGQASIQPVEPAYPMEVPAQGMHAGPSVFTTFLRKWRLIVLIALGTCVVGLPIIWLAVKPQYTATAAIKVDPVTQAIVFDQESGAMPFYSTYVSTQANLIKSGRILYPVLEDPLVRAQDYLKHFDDAFVELQNSFTAAADKNSQLIYVSMTGTDAKAVTEIANAAVRAYMKIEGGTSATAEDDKLRTIERERDATSEKLKGLYEAAYQLGEEFGATDLSSRQDVMLSRVQVLQENLTNVEGQHLILAMRLAVLKSRQGTQQNPAEFIQAKTQAIQNDAVVSNLRNSLNSMEQRYLLEASKRKEDTPELVNLKQDIESVKNALATAEKVADEKFEQMMAEIRASKTETAVQEFELQLEEVKAQEKHLTDELEKQNTSVLALGRKSLALKKLQDDISFTRDYYERLNERVQVLQVERQRPARVSVAYQAEVPRKPANDKRMKYSVVLVLGSLAFATAFVFFLQELDPRVETPWEVESRVGLRILGTIPRFQDLDKARVKPKHFVDDCRTIRVNLTLAAGEKPARMLVVASPQGRDGKTTLAINLATSIALTGKNVLLIDGDVRKPEVARYLRLNNSRGLSNVLAGECPLEAAVQPTMLATLSVLPSNRRTFRQKELLASNTLADLLVNARAYYDEIIIDTPAILAMPDAKLWATVADGVILVARSARTSASNLQEAKTRILQAGARILGVVLTGVRIGDSYEKYQHRYGEGYVDEPVSEEDWNATKVFLLSRQLGETKKEYERGLFDDEKLEDK